ncbi:MAG: hypothetical protein LBD36_02355, partial [Holosporales bacterium]|nr:hypothetical protein [Holosporales bacterium]
MSVFQKVLLFLVVFVTRLSAAEFASLDERIKGAHVFFDVATTSLGLELTGTENGRTVFRTRLPKNLAMFDELSQGPFYAAKVDDGVQWGYASELEGETFDVLVKSNGDVTLLDSIQNYAGHDKKKRYAFRTSGTLENLGNLAFYDIVTSAQQFHNYGTLQAFNCTLAQNYLFNSGFMQFGKIPEEAVDLRNPLQQVLLQQVQPEYKHYAVENYGTFYANGKFQIKGGLNYFEYGTSDFEDLQMFGGSVSIGKPKKPSPPSRTVSTSSAPSSSSSSSSSSRSSSTSSSSPLESLFSELSGSLPSQMGVRGTLNGTIHDFSVADNSTFLGQTLSFS